MNTTKMRIVAIVILATIMCFVLVSASLVALNLMIRGTNYTVTFDSNGGSEVETQTVKEGEKATEPSFPAKENLGFFGWYVNPKTAKDIEYPFSFETPITEDITLTALWSAQLRVMTDGKGQIGLGYNNEEPTFSEGQPIQVAYEVSVIGIYDNTVKIIEKPDEGWKFVCWKNELTGETYSTDSIIKIPIKENMELLAVFEPE